LRQHLDQPPLGGREAYLALGTGDPLGGQIDGEVDGPDDRVGWCASAAAQRRPQAGQQLVHAEGLGDVVVGTGI
jgi:hypothetical protein